MWVDYDEVFVRLVFETECGAGRNLKAAVRSGAVPAATSDWFPESAECRSSRAAEEGVLPFHWRGFLILSELKVGEDTLRTPTPEKDFKLEPLSLLCRTPACCIIVFAGFYGLFRRPLREILRAIWNKTATRATFEMHARTPFFCRMYCSEFQSPGFRRTNPATVWAARQVQGARVGGK